MWYSVANPLIVVTNETSNVWPFKAEVLTHGTITIEGGTNMKLLEGGPVHHAGFLEAWMDSVSFDRGQFFLVSFVGSDANGALNIAFQPHEMVLALEPGNTTVELPACGGACIVDSRVTAPDYVWMRTHLLSTDGFGAAFLSELSQGRSFDATGAVGPVEYVASDGPTALTFCNPKLKGSTVLDLTVTQVRQPRDRTGPTKSGGGQRGRPLLSGGLA